MGIMDLNTLNNPLLLPFRAYIFFGIVISPSIIGSLSATSISREGKFFWETRIMPISHKESLASRELTTLLLNGIGQILLAIVAYTILPIEPIQLVVVLLAVVFFTLLMSNIDLIINIERPFLNWSNPTACIKNNMNVMLSLGSRVIIGGLGYLLYTLIKNEEATLIMLILGLMALILYIITRLLIAKIYLKKYEQIDAI
jgi:ABC-2 type transport system permease protein